MTTKPQISRAAAGIVIAIFAMLILAADQFTKFLAIENLEPKVATPILGDFLQFYLVRNPGAAFSLGEGVTWIFTIALGLVAIAVVVLAFTRVRSLRWMFVLGALLGGVCGNLTDRVLRDPGFPVGHVVDFIHTPWMMPAIYNVADIFIVTSMIFVATLILLGINLDGSTEKSKKAEAAAAEATEADAAEAEASSEADAVAQDETVDDEPVVAETRRERRERLAANDESEPAHS